MSKKDDKGLKHVTNYPNLTFKKKIYACPENTVLPFRVHKYDSKLRDCFLKKKTIIKNPVRKNTQLLTLPEKDNAVKQDCATWVLDILKCSCTE